LCSKEQANFWGCEGCLPEFSKRTREKTPTSETKALHVLLGAVGCQFCSDFQGFCEGFHRFCPDFHVFFQDFHQIKTFGGALASPAPPHATPVVQHKIGML